MRGWETKQSSPSRNLLAPGSGAPAATPRPGVEHACPPVRVPPFARRVPLFCEAKANVVSGAPPGLAGYKLFFLLLSEKSLGFSSPSSSLFPLRLLCHSGFPRVGGEVRICARGSQFDSRGGEAASALRTTLRGVRGCFRHFGGRAAPPPLR